MTYYLRLTSIWITVMILMGCHGGVETDILERELRLQEDRIYELEDYIKQYQSMLKECQAQQGNLDFEPGSELLPPEAPTELTAPERPDPDIPDFQPPPVTEGTEVDPPQTENAAPPTNGPGKSERGVRWAPPSNWLPSESVARPATIDRRSNSRSKSELDARWKASQRAAIAVNAHPSVPQGDADRVPMAGPSDAPKQRPTVDRVKRAFPRPVWKPYR